jgi:osmotically-inducible protein OsmY
MSGEPLPTPDADKAEAILKHRLVGRVAALRVLIQEGGVVLQGQAASHHAKQLAQHVAMQVLGLPILLNEIEVFVAPSPGVDQSPESS